MISIVIPVYNENESLPVLQEEIASVLQRENIEGEVLYVDDGSRDGSWQTIARFAASSPNVHGIRFRRNFGKAAALSAGFRHAKGDIVLTLDADLQDDPAEIPNFLKRLNEGHDVVSGWKRRRLDPWHKVWPSRVFNFLVSRSTGVRLHDHNCGMKCYRATVFREIRLYGELHRFIPVLAAARGFRVGEMEINHRPRKFGRSKYGARRFIKGFLDLLTVKFLTGYGQRPQHFLGTIGFFSCLFGALGILYLIVTWLINVAYPGTFEPLHRRPLLVICVGLVLLGAQMMSIGFLAELILAYQGRDEDSFSIAEKTEPMASHPLSAAEGPAVQT